MRERGQVRGRAPVGWLKASDMVAVAVAVCAFTGALWVVDGGVSALLSGGSSMLASLGQITGLAGALAALFGLVLASRWRVMERRWGLDRMLGYHRWLGISTAILVSAHVLLDTWARAAQTDDSLWGALVQMLGEDWMVSALVGFLLIAIVALSSWRRIKHVISYETWYFVHLLGYLAVVVAFAHQLTAGNDIAGNRLGWWWWVGLYIAAAALIVGARLGESVKAAWRGGRVVTVSRETPEVVSFTVDSPRLRAMHARGGQFFQVRVLTGQHWWHPHPLSLSAAPQGQGLRFTVKALGDGTEQLGSIRVGTRMWLEGPYGVFTTARARGGKLLLVAAGVGVTPILAMLGESTSRQQPIVIVRVRNEEDLPHREELEAMVNARGGKLHVIVGRRSVRAATDPLSAQAMANLVPDMGERHVFVCGPDAFSMAVIKSTRQAGARKGRVHAERFGY